MLRTRIRMHKMVQFSSLYLTLHPRPCALNHMGSSLNWGLFGRCFTRVSYYLGDLKGGLKLESYAYSLGAYTSTK